MSSSPETPLVSAVVTTVRGGAFLGEAACSVLGQTVADVELVVVTNAEGVDLSQLPDDERVRIVHQSRRGRAWAANLGAHVARGRWLAMLDDDDVWEPTKLEMQLAALRSWGGAPASLTQFRLIDAAGASIGDGWGAPTSYVGLLSGRVSFLFSSLVLSRELWGEVGGIEPRVTYSDDFALLLAVHAVGPAVFVDQPLVRYRRHPATMSRRQALELASWQSVVLASERRLAAKRGDWAAWRASWAGTVHARRWTASEAFAEADQSRHQGEYRRAARLAWMGVRASPPDALRLVVKRAARRV